MIRGPVKRPDRALQKAHRKYFMDPRCLTDLVRGCVLLGSLEDVDHCLEVILGMSVIGSLGTRWEEVPASSTPDAGKEIKNQALADLLAETPAWTVTREELEGSNGQGQVHKRPGGRLSRHLLEPGGGVDDFERVGRGARLFASLRQPGPKLGCHAPHSHPHLRSAAPAGEHVHTQGDRVPRQLCRSPQLSRAVRHLSALFLRYTA
ncbi:MAG: hypothetical protein ACPIOQ_31390, partial [Promethearchaeia archaeon]